MLPRDCRMKKLSTYLFLLLFSFQTPSWADDIRDFQIEGMSIGDSLLKYASEDEIKNEMITDYPGSKKFSRFFKKFSRYDDVQFHFKTMDKKYIIYSITGVIYYPNDLESCQDERAKVIDDIKQTLQISKVINMGEQINNNKDGTLRSSTYNSYIEFENGFIDMTCYNWSKEYESNSNVSDSLKVSFMTKEMNTWVHEEAFK